jgi:hypothetical protein
MNTDDNAKDLTVVNRGDVLRRMGGLAAAIGMAPALASMQAPKAEPVPEVVDAVAIDEERMYAAFRRMFAPGTVMTGALMADAMMMAVTGRIPDEETPEQVRAREIEAQRAVEQRRERASLKPSRQEIESKDKRA